MKIIFSSFAIVLILFSFTFGQAQIDIPILVSDGSYTIQMAVGLDLTATNCIDLHLGESDLPPVPPTGVFDSRFNLQQLGCGPVSTYKDYRPPGNPPAFPFTGMIQHYLLWQSSGPELPIDITYNLPPSTLMYITDPFGGVLFNLGPFVGQGIATIPGTFSQLGSAFLKMQYNCIGGDPNEPIFGISTLNLNFPSMIAGNDTTLPVVVTNSGMLDTLSITNIVSSNTHFTIAPSSVPIFVAPQDSQVFQVTNTAAINAEQGTIQFSHNGCGSPTTMNVFAPAGIPPGPSFTMSTSSLVFIQDTVGAVDSLPVTISNEGYANTLYINYISSNNNYFNIYPNLFPVAIEPQSSLNFVVTYTSTNTTQQGIIEFTHNAPGSPHLLYVSSANSYAQFSIYPASLYFVLQPLSRTVHIKNNGPIDTLVISSITSSNSNYTVTPNVFPVYIPPDITNNFTISLNNSPGFQFAIIRIYHNATGSPYLLFATNQPLPPVAEGTIVVQSGPMSQTLKFGIDSLASDDIDEIMGEMDIPPPPPQGVFDARYIMPVNNFSGSLNSLRDFRYGTSLFVGQKEYRLSYQKNYENGIEISWDLPPNITGVLRDIINGSFINVPIADTGSFIVQDPLTFNKLRMLIDFNETPTSLNELEVIVDFTPKEFVLYQNYPNPFNPNTVISYQLPVTSNVTLKVYDILGNEVATLVSEEKQPGVYEVEFNPASSIKHPASGVYFYQLRAEGFIQTKKMILTK